MGDFVSASAEDVDAPEVVQMTLLLNERRAAETYGTPDFALFTDGKRPLPQIKEGTGMMDVEKVFLSLAEKGE